MRIDRMLSITIMLLNRDKITAREFADKFEVSVRTIYRDIEAINVAGIPIVSYSGNNGGFGILENYKIDRQALTSKEMFAILSALKGINKTLGNKELDSAIEKIRSLTPKDKTDLLNLHYEQIVIDILPWGARGKEKEFIKTIHNSINENKLLQFEYCNSKGEESFRTVEPMTLIFKGYAWYLFTFCLLKEDYRLFRLSRIKGLKTLDKIFIRRNKSYRDIMDPSREKLNLVHLTLKFSPKVRVRIEDSFIRDQLTHMDNGDIIAEVSFPQEDWIYGWILGFGEDVEVLKPVHFRNIIKEKSEKILNIYKPDTRLSQD